MGFLWLIIVQEIFHTDTLHHSHYFNCQFIECSAPVYGALLFRCVNNILVDSCSFRNNTVKNAGGAIGIYGNQILVDGYDENTKNDDEIYFTPIITNSNFSNNKVIHTTLNRNFEETEYPGFKFVGLPLSGYYVLINGGAAILVRSNKDVFIEGCIFTNNSCVHPNPKELTFRGNDIRLRDFLILYLYNCTFNGNDNNSIYHDMIYYLYDRYGSQIKFYEKDNKYYEGEIVPFQDVEYYTFGKESYLYKMAYPTFTKVPYIVPPTTTLPPLSRTPGPVSRKLFQTPSNTLPFRSNIIKTFAEYSPRFSQSNFFTNSNLFSKSGLFSNSKAFSKSNIFTNSDRFGATKRFTKSSYFTRSNYFTESSHFTKSSHFSKTDVFSESHTLIIKTTRAFSKSNFFSRSSEFSESDKLPTNSFTGSKEFTKSDVFTASDVFTSSVEFTDSALMIPTVTPSPSNEKESLSRSVSISLTYVKSVSKTASFINSLTMSCFFSDSTCYITYINVLAVTPIPYIIYYLSPTYLEMMVAVNNNMKRKGLNQQQVIGVSCGSAAVFFFILSVGIFIYRKKHFKMYSDLSLHLSSDLEDDSNMETRPDTNLTSVGVSIDDNNKIENTLDMWL